MGHPRGHPHPHPRVDIKQWTVRLSQALIKAVKAQAAAEGKEPSHLVEEVLWQALTDR
jgi:predicted DNA binding CopG/RHH family protein